MYIIYMSEVRLREIIEKLTTFPFPIPEIIRNITLFSLSTILNLLKTHVDHLKKFSDLLMFHLRLMTERTPIYVVRDFKSITVTSTDLEQLPGKVIFENIDELKFESDVKIEVFRNKVEQIRNINKLYIPKTLPKLLVYSKCTNVNEIIEI